MWITFCFTTLSIYTNSSQTKFAKSMPLFVNLIVSPSISNKFSFTNFSSSRLYTNIGFSPNLFLKLFIEIPIYFSES